MSDEQALGISDLLFKPVLLRLIDGLQQKSVEGVSRNGGVRILITGNVSVAKVAIGSQLANQPYLQTINCFRNCSEHLALSISNENHTEGTRQLAG